ncbi:hypothetical protein [Desulfoscipio gibsoniae]
MKMALGVDRALIVDVHAIRLAEIIIPIPHDTARPDKRLALFNREALVVFQRRQRLVKLCPC